MRLLQFLTLLSSLTFYACGQKPNEYKSDPVVEELINQAGDLLLYKENLDSAKKALFLLDKAISIDSNYFIAHITKLPFFYKLKQFDSAILTINKSIQLKPNEHNLYLTGGMLCELIGDTTESKFYFTKMISICKTILAKKNVSKNDYFMYSMNQGISLIMLGDSVKANQILKDLYNSLPDNPRIDKINVQSFMNKSKAQVFNKIMDPKIYSR